MRPAPPPGLPWLLRKLPRISRCVLRQPENAHSAAQRDGRCRCRDRAKSFPHRSAEFSDKGVSGTYRVDDSTTSGFGLWTLDFPETQKARWSDVQRAFSVTVAGL